MFKKLLILVCFSFGLTPCQTYAQDNVHSANITRGECYYLFRAAAKVSYSQKEYAISALYWRWALDTKTVPRKKDLTMAALAQFRADTLDLAYSLLDEAVSTGIELEFITNVFVNDQFSKPFPTDRWKKFVADYPTNHQKALASIDFEMSQLIVSMAANDQYIRKKVVVLKDTNTTKYQVNVDKQNFKELKGVFEKKGFPSERVLLPDVDKKLVLVLQHLVLMEESEWSYLKDKLEIQLKEGGIDPEDYAFLVDKRNVQKLHTVQTYGNFNRSDEFEPIDDIKNVDIRRRKIGLCSLKEFANDKGLILPKDYIYQSDEDYRQINCK
jgi:hypothetical protein